MFGRTLLFPCFLLTACSYYVPSSPPQDAEESVSTPEESTEVDADDDDTLPADDDDTIDTPPVDEPLDPFASRPNTTEGLVNTSYDLAELLEFGALQGACEAYASNPMDRRLKLLCGKWMFFYEGFGTQGIPQPLMDWMSRNFPDEAGLAFTNYGLVEDPYVTTAEQARHLGVGEGAPMGSTPTLALTCANCHFGQMPDGRYAVGYPNLQYEYGTHMLSLFIGPMKGMPGFDPDTYHPDAIEAVQPILDRFDADPLLGLGLAWNLLPMLVGGVGDIPSLSYENQGQYASWASGTMDFTMAPLPIEDGVHTISRTLPLWGVPTADEQAEYGMDSAMLAWTGAAESLNEFLVGFVVVGGGPVDDWGPDELSPIREYLESLDAPPPVGPSDPLSIEAGRILFSSAGCIDCHSGARGGGTRVYEFDEVGTDPALALWGDSDGDGEMCCGLEGNLTGGVKAPRLTGLHALTRFLHNGSLSTLEQLLCLEGRPPLAQPPYANIGHEFGCDLPDGEKTKLLHFLRSL